MYKEDLYVVYENGYDLLIQMTAIELNNCSKLRLTNPLLQLYVTRKI